MNRPTSDGSVAITPLMMAAMQDDVTMARLLIERGADVTARNRVGMSVPRMAARNPELMALLEAVEGRKHSDAAKDTRE